MKPKIQTLRLSGGHVACRLWIAVMVATLLSLSAMAAIAEEDARTVLITGSSKGHGLNFVNDYAERGWNVIATCRLSGKGDSREHDRASARPRLEIGVRVSLDEAQKGRHDVPRGFWIRGTPPRAQQVAPTDATVGRGVLCAAEPVGRGLQMNFVVLYRAFNVDYSIDQLTQVPRTPGSSLQHDSCQTTRSSVHGRQYSLVVPVLYLRGFLR